MSQVIELFKGDPAQIPHSVEAEQGVLGCCLLSPTDCIPDALKAFGGNPEVFYDIRHEVIWIEMCGLMDEGVPVEMITIQSRLRDKGILEGVGGLAYIAALPDVVPSAANLGYYTSIVMEKFKLRRLKWTCENVAAKVGQFKAGDVDTLLAEVEQDIFACCQSDAQASTRKDSFVRLTSMLEGAMLNQGKLDGLETGLRSVDRILGGLKSGTMNVIAARPAMGKSALGFGIIEHNAKQGIGGGVFSLEMGEDELNLRTICSTASVNGRLARTGMLSERDINRITMNIGSLSKLPIQVCDRSDMSIQRIRSEGRRMVSRGAKVLLVDYLQLVSGGGRYGRREDVDEVSRGIKNMAKELNVPVIALAQLNREIEREAGRRPRLADLRESGGIEQDADTVSFIYCPDDTQIRDDGTLPVKFSTQKNRNGDIGECDLLFERKFTRFVEVPFDAPATQENT